MPSYKETVEAGRKSPNSTYSPEFSFPAFHTFWTNRAKEIGFDEALKEYHDCPAPHFKERIEATKDLHELGEFFAHAKFTHHQ